MRLMPFEEAFKAMMSEAGRLGSESVPLCESVGRVLSEDVASDVDMPPFDKSAMDGYACRRSDLEMPLKIVETIPAGKKPEREIGEGECSKIMTGAAVPSGADCVVMVEHTETRDGNVVVKKKSGRDNICYLAEDVARGDIVLNRGTVIGAPEVAVLAAVGFSEVPVSRRPVIGIIATGSELVEPSEKPSGAMIRNSNSYQLAVQARTAGFKPVYFGIAGDTPEDIRGALEAAGDENDVLLLSGGVSMGEFDFVPGILREKGYDLLFEKVAIKPGKPTVFGRSADGYVFGMPGNPVSTFVVFEIFVKPFCYKLMGADYNPVRVKAPLAETVRRRKSDRLAHIPVRFDPDGKAALVEYHGSAHIHSYAAAAGFISFPIGTETLQAGSDVTVTLI